MKPWGFAIPGLAMNASELPDIPGLVRLQQPGFGACTDWEGAYGIEDLAAFHLRTIRSQVALGDELLIIGMSMGGMVASVLGSTLRDQLPPKTRFRFLVTSSNQRDLPCITKDMLARWYQARPGNDESFTAILTPFVGAQFRARHPDIMRDYIHYRAHGGNGQSAAAFLKQLAAVIQFDGTDYFAGLNADETEFVHGGADEIMTVGHHSRLRNLQPHAQHVVVPEMGHMVNIEAPHFFQKERAGHA